MGLFGGGGKREKVSLDRVIKPEQRAETQEERRALIESILRLDSAAIYTEYFAQNPEQVDATAKKLAETIMRGSGFTELPVVQDKLRIMRENEGGNPKKAIGALEAALGEKRYEKK